MKKIKITHTALFESIRPRLRKKYNVKYPGPGADHAAILKLYDKVPEYITHGIPVHYYPGIFRIFPKNWKPGESLNESWHPIYKTSLPGARVISALKQDIFFLSDKTTIETVGEIDAMGVPSHINIVAHIRDIKNGTIEHIMELMTDAGYYLAYSTRTDDNRYWWQFEPYHYGQIRDQLEPVVFHVTELKHKASIKTKGLIASCKNPIFEYPPRNYFFNSPDKLSFIAYATVNNKIDDSGHFLVCHVDTSMLDDVAFYADPNYKDRPAVFTYDDIPSEAIIKYTEDTIK